MRKFSLLLIFLTVPISGLFCQVYYTDSLDIYDFALNRQNQTLIIPGNQAFHFYMVNDVSPERVIPTDLDSRVTRMAVSDDGTLMVAGYMNGSLITMTLPEGNLKNLPERMSMVTTVGVSEKDSIIAAGYADGTLRIMDLASGKITDIERAHKKSLNDLKFLDGGSKIITAGGDGRVQLWDSRSGKKIAEIKKFPFWLRSITISQDNKEMMICGDFGILATFQISPKGLYQQVNKDILLDGWLTGVSFFPTSWDYVVTSYSGKVIVEMGLGTLKMTSEMNAPVYRVRTSVEGSLLVVYIASGNKVQRIYVKDM